ncbi:MAG: nuclear transport factor 2 family protein [Solirubrobacteraceae bacterium]
MSPSDALDRYFADWNAHDPAAVVGSPVDGGTHQDPTTAGPPRGDALAKNVARLLVGFPDVHLDLVSVAPTRLGSRGVRS